MGEVYRARDTRLDRTVAIKVLPSAFSDDPTLRQRLEREARAVSALDHPNICALYDIGNENGLDFIVMQHLTGETLAARLARGPLTLDEVSTFGAQIADALAAAHRRGIIHRDLKPGNIMVGREGIRLLDFGLAKQQEPFAAAAAAQTMSTPLTGARTIVGTLHYMAPEQLEGRTVDPRTDIFALGAVLYEMITGRRAFEGESSASLITAIMTGRRVPIATVAPPPLMRIVDRCLATDPEDRWQSASDLAYALRNLRQNSGETAAVVPPRPRSSRWMWAGAAVLAVGTVAAVIVIAFGRGTAAMPEVRLSIVPPAGFEIAGDAADFNPEFAVSPDGSRIAFVAVNPAGKESLWLRDLASVTAREIGGTAGARRPFWSPDGRVIGYSTEAGLARVSPDGGGSSEIPTKPAAAAKAGATWTPDGRIIYEAPATPGSSSMSLFVVAAEGGTATPVMKLAPEQREQAQLYPVILPDGQHFVYLSWTVDPAERGIYLGKLGSDMRRLLVRTGFGPRFIAPDLLVYVRDRAVVAQRLSLRDAQLTGESMPIASGVALEAIPGQAAFTTSITGVFAYRSRERDVSSELRWTDRNGRSEEVFETGADISVSLAGDTRRAAVARLNNSRLDAERFPSNVWLLDLSRRVLSRLTLDAASTDENPTWSPDGTEVAYATHRGGGLAEVLVQRVGSAAPPRVVASGSLNFHPIDWSADGTLLLHAYATRTGADDLDLYTLARGASANPAPLIEAPGLQAQGQFSPDGKWIAYTSDESGSLQVYVRSRQAGESRFQVSSDGGAQPRWRGDSRELYYVSRTGELVAVPLSADADGLTPGRPIVLFTEPSLKPNNSLFFYGGAAGYAVAPDGKRFLINRMLRAPGPGPIHIVLNWNRR